MDWISGDLYQTNGINFFCVPLETLSAPVNFYGKSCNIKTKFPTNNKSTKQNYSPVTKDTVSYDSYIYIFILFMK